jgi:molybdenum cofactor synthesis domain-containing protein
MRIEKNMHPYPGHHLLKKTELKIDHISFKNANLNDIARVFAEELGMAYQDVFVTDLRDDSITIDVLREDVDARQIIGKQNTILRRLEKIPGVSISSDTSITSNGMLGWVAIDDEDALSALKRSEDMINTINLKLSKRVVVFSSGEEVLTGQIEDTNSPAIAKRLEAEGYIVKQGGCLIDDLELIESSLKDVIDNEGYRLVITTGGVGAEDKDKTVEAIMNLDPKAVTPYICTFEKGTGRHVKDGVRIAVGRYSDALLIALPGPNDEVIMSLESIVGGLKANIDTHAMAETIAKTLRNKFRKRN